MPQGATGAASPPHITTMIKPPFTPYHRDGRSWIVDSEGIAVADINTLLDPLEAGMIAELLATGANERLRQLNHLTKISKKGGRPRSKKPSKAALAKRRERAREAE